jgi:hypothetical protein
MKDSKVETACEHPTAPGDTRFTAATRLCPIGALALGTSACSPTEPRTGAMFPAEGVVYGSIRNTAGQLQPGAVFEVSVFARSCDPTNSMLDPYPTVSEDGTFRLYLRGPHFREIDACLVVHATVDTSDGALEGTVRDAHVTLRSIQTGVGPLDSVQVDVEVK